jgi:hypothetical protein
LVVQGDGSAVSSASIVTTLATTASPINLNSYKGACSGTQYGATVTPNTCVIVILAQFGGSTSTFGLNATCAGSIWSAHFYPGGNCAINNTIAQSGTGNTCYSFQSDGSEYYYEMSCPSAPLVSVYPSTVPTSSPSGEGSSDGVDDDDGLSTSMITIIVVVAVGGVVLFASIGAIVYYYTSKPSTPSQPTPIADVVNPVANSQQQKQNHVEEA